MRKQIINYFGEIHGAYLHAKGKVASRQLIELLDCQPDEQILEIGFGSGATLAQLAADFRKTKFYGIETSETMFGTAKKRIAFSLLTGSINLKLVGKENNIPFNDNFFDKVFAESVLAIQEVENLNQILLEIKRILKPDGTFILNETIWLDSIDSFTAAEINAACKKAFGIIQSNSEIIHLADWETKLTQYGFETDKVIRINENTEVPKIAFNLKRILSDIYTQMGKIKLLLSPTLRREWKNYTREMKSIFQPNKQLMEGIIIKAVNRKEW